MPINSLLRAVLVLILAAALTKPARADQFATDARLIVTGIVVVSAAVAVTVTLLIVKHKSAVTGCVKQGPKGMTVTDEDDKQVYAIFGSPKMFESPTGVKAGERVKLWGKKKKLSDGAVALMVQRTSKDLGACPI
jgi:hypothetical protein